MKRLESFIDADSSKRLIESIIILATCVIDPDFERISALAGSTNPTTQSTVISEKLYGNNSFVARSISANTMTFSGGTAFWLSIIYFNYRRITRLGSGPSVCYHTARSAVFMM